MPNIYNSGANYSYSITPVSHGGTPINYSAPLIGGKNVIADNATPEQIAAAGNDVYVPLSKRRSSYGNVFNPANANAMDYSLYTNYYSPTPAMSLGAMVSQAQGQQSQPRGYSGQGSLGSSQTGAGHGVGMGQTDRSFLQNYDKNLSNIQQGIAQGTMAWAQTLEQAAADTEAARQAALQNPWWGDSAGNRHYGGAPSQEEVSGWSSQMQAIQTQMGQRQSQIQDLLSRINQSSDPAVQRYYLTQYRDALDSYNQLQSSYNNLQGDVNNWTSWYSNRSP